jgi:hypothetical protein
MGAMNIVSSYKPNPNFTVPTPEQEDSLQNAGLLMLAVERFREEAADALKTVPPTRESYTRYQLLAAAWKAAERAAARDYEAAGMPLSFLGLRPEADMAKHGEHLPAALDHVSAEYRAALRAVGNGGLIDASILDATRQAIQHEITLL